MKYGVSLYMRPLARQYFSKSDRKEQSPVKHAEQTVGMKGIFVEALTKISLTNVGL